MKKNICRLSVLLLFVITLYANSWKNALNEDCDYLSKVISEGWVCYDEAVENGFDLDKSIKNIKKLYSKQVKHITANFNDKLNYKNGLETYSLLNLIQGIIFEQINFKDGHYKMYNENTTFAHWNTQAFFSKLFFEKKGEKYFVYYSDNPQIKKGMEYTGNLIDLVPVIYNNEKLFRFVHFSDEKRNQVNTEVNVESRLIPVRLEKDNCIKMNDSIFLKETSSTVYICINTFEIDDKELNNQFSDLQKQISTIDFTNKDLVINLRDNLGGYENFVKEFIKNLILATMKVSPLDAQLYINETEKGIVSLMSPLLSEQVYLQYMQLSDSISEYLIDQVKNRYFELKENPRRYYIDYDSVVSKKVTENNSSINKVYVLMNNDTISAAELVIALSYIFGQDKVCLLGNNSRGSLDYGSVFKYELPNSGIKIILPSNSNKKCNYLSKNPNWHGDTKGFYPDYWATNENILDTLVYLTKDEELRTVLADLDKGIQ